MGSDTPVQKENDAQFCSKETECRSLQRWVGREVWLRQVLALDTAIHDS